VGKLKKMIPGVIMTKRIIKQDIPGHIKTKRSCLTSPGTVRDIKSERETLQRSILMFLKLISFFLLVTIWKN